MRWLGSGFEGRREVNEWRGGWRVELRLKNSGVGGCS